MYIVGKWQRPRDFALRVMIAMQNIYGYVGLLESYQLLKKEQARLVVPPVAVIEVSRDDDKRYTFVERKLHEILKGCTRSYQQFLSGAFIVLSQPAERTVQMDVRCVDKLKRLSQVIYLIFILCGVSSKMQTAFRDGPIFDTLSLCQNLLPASEVSIGRRQVLQLLVPAFDFAVMTR